MLELQDEGQLSPATEREWAQALLKIRKKDPSLYDASTSLFNEANAPESDGSEDVQDHDVQIRKKKSKKTLRDILYDQVCPSSCVRLQNNAESSSQSVQHDPG